MEAKSCVTSAHAGDGDGDHPMMMMVLAMMLMLMALSFHCDHEHVHFSLHRIIKSNRDNCADGLIDEACLTGNQCRISAIAPLSDARAPGTFGGGRELG